MAAHLPKDHIKKQCTVCASGMSPCVKDYFVCNSCRYMSSVLPPGHGAEVGGIAPVRIKNYKTICSIIKKLTPPHQTTILDVGCANGLFLKAAQHEGFCAVGLEPDTGNASIARSQGFEIIDGFFPGAVGLADKTFDVIIFNDSFEHIPNLEHVMRGIKGNLKEGGVVIVNIPSSDGLIFTLSLLMSRLGILSPLDRLWQKGFASPHLHYFNPANLQALFEKYGFKKIYHAPLRCYTLENLWERIRCNTPLWKALIAWCGLMVFSPFYFTLKSKSDIFVSVFKYNH